MISVLNQENDAASLKELADGQPILLPDSDLNLTDQLVDAEGNGGVELDMSIFERFSEYNDGADYTLIPIRSGKYNSNSFAPSIAERAGVNNYPKDLPGYDPGTQNRLPDRYFESD